MVPDAARPALVSPAIVGPAWRPPGFVGPVGRPGIVVDQGAEPLTPGAATRSLRADIA
jgi:hypothetical protein